RAGRAHGGGVGPGFRRMGARGTRGGRDRAVPLPAVPAAVGNDSSSRRSVIAAVFRGAWLAALAAALPTTVMGQGAGLPGHMPLRECRAFPRDTLRLELVSPFRLQRAGAELAEGRDYRRLGDSVIVFPGDASDSLCVTRFVSPVLP